MSIISRLLVIVLSSVLCTSFIPVAAAFSSPSWTSSTLRSRSVTRAGVRATVCELEAWSRRTVVAGLFVGAACQPVAAFQDYDSWKADRDRRESVSADEFMVEFGQGSLGLDLQEVRFTAGYSRLMIKGIKPQSQAAELQASTGLRPKLFVKKANGVLLEGVQASSALQVIQREKKQLDSEGKQLKLLLAPPTLEEKFELQEKMAEGA